MKKLNFLMSMLAMVGVMFFASCDDDEDTPAPTVTIPGSAPSTAIVGDTVSFNVAVTSSAALQSIVTTEGGNPIAALTKNDGFQSETSDSYAFEYAPDNNDAGDTLTFTITATDEEGNTGSAEYTLFAEPTSGPINTYTQVLLNNNFSTTQSSFYDAVGDNVYQSLSAARSNADKVDFIHHLRNANSGGRQISSPDSDNADAAYGDTDASDDALPNWSTLNETRFKKITLSEADFNAIDNDATIVAETETGVTATDATELAPGEVYAFRTDGGKRGIFYIRAVDGPAAFQAGGDNAGSVTIEVKVQQ
mgnify:CR=1 FL=1